MENPRTKGASTKALEIMELLLGNCPACFISRLGNLDRLLLVSKKENPKLALFIFIYPDFRLVLYCDVVHQQIPTCL